MAEYLVIRLPAADSASAEWIVVDDQGTRLSPPGAGPLADAAGAANGRIVTGLVPAAPVLTTEVDIPVRSQSRLLAALPYALEENLAEDVDRLHFAAGKRLEDGRTPVAVVATEQIQAWLATFAEAGIDVDRLIPENHGLASVPGTWSVLLDGDEIFVNNGDTQSFAMQGIGPADALAVAGLLVDDVADDADDSDAEPAPARHLLAYLDSAAEEAHQHDWNVLRHELDSVNLQVLPDGPLPRLAITVAAGHGINLLQGPFATRSNAGASLAPWRNAALLLVALGIIGLLGVGVDTWRLKQEEASLKAQFGELYQELRPGDTRDIVDPTAIVRSVRNELAGPTAVQVFLPSMLELGTALQNSGADIEAISYRAGVIDVRLTAPDVATLDTIQKKVSDSGRFSAAIQSTDQVGDKVSSRIQIREAGA